MTDDGFIEPKATRPLEMVEAGSVAALQAEIERLRKREIEFEEWERTWTNRDEERDVLIERLRSALEVYACPGLGQCREPRLDDGSCLAEASGGRCGDEARRALENKP